MCSVDKSLLLVQLSVTSALSFSSFRLHCVFHCAQYRLSLLRLCIYIQSLSLSLSLFFCLSWKTVYAYSGEKKNFLRLWCPLSRAEQHISYSPKSQFWVPFIRINTPNFWGTDFLLELYRNPKISSTHSIHQFYRAGKKGRKRCNKVAKITVTWKQNEHQNPVFLTLI